MFKRLLASVGIGGATLELKLGSSEYARGGVIAGEITLIGGRVEQRFEVLRVRLLDHFVHASNSDPVREEQILMVRFTIYPQSREVYPFTFRLSEDANLSVSEATSSWRIDVIAQPVWALSLRANLPFHVKPHHEVMAVKLAFQTLGFAPVSSFTNLSLQEGDYYIADSRMRGQIEGAWLYLQASGSHILGRVAVKRHPRGVGSQILAFINADLEQYEFQIPRANLLTVKGGPDLNGALPSLKSILARALPQENKDAQTLLRAATGPEDQSTLLRPANSGSSTPASRLLHPAPAPEAPRGDPSASD